MTRRRRRSPSTRFWAAAFGALGAGCAAGAFIGWDAIGSIDPFYRFGRADEWRPRFVNPAQGPERPAPVLAAGPVWTAPPLIPAADPYDDVRLLGAGGEVRADANIDRELRRLQRDIEEDARRWSERLDAEFPARPEPASPSAPALPASAALPVAPAPTEPAAPAPFATDPPPRTTPSLAEI